MMSQDSIPSYWRKIKANYRLIGTKCEREDKIFFPPRSVCPSCREKLSNEVELSGKGKVLTHTTIHVAAKGFENQVPYSMAVIELEEGVRLTSAIVGIHPQDVYPGLPVKTTFRRLSQAETEDSIIRYGFKFTPANYPRINCENQEMHGAELMEAREQLAGTARIRK
ncbi:MAG: Zn-ribbon domain-containing OB-fold protein [Candidatus Hermodarchaeota archaeon]